MSNNNADDEAYVIKLIEQPRRKRYSGFTETLRKCQIGESFIMESKLYGAYETARRLGMKVAIRKEPDGRLRVWRIG